MSSYHGNMATSVPMSSDHNRTLQPLTEDHQTKPPETARQRGGRRKCKANESTQKQKKERRRGLGVAQLERLRLQERWKKMTDMNNPLPSYTLQNHPFVSSFAQPTMMNNGPVPFAMSGAFGGSNGGGHLWLNQWFHGQNESFRVGNMDETSKELSSMPNIKCFSDQCGFCHKKKLINGENFTCNGPSMNGCGFVSFSVGNNHNINVGNQDFGTKPAIHSGYAVGNSADKSVEVVAVHRKGSSGGGAVVMEYEFFPEKGGSSSSSHNDSMMKLGSESSSAAEVDAEAYCVSTTTGVESSSSIDLSLKLYC